MTLEFIVYMLQEEFHILYSPFVQTKDNTFFFRLCIRNSISCVFNCNDLLCIYFFMLQSQYIAFIYSSFQLHLPQLYHEPFNDQLSVALQLNWLQLCTGIAEVRDRILASLNFLRLSFHNCISCIFNCDDLVCIYFFIPQFQYIRFIYSSFHLHLSQMYHKPI